MGYSYDVRTGQLCCDRCGTHGGVRRVNCKHGYCQAIAFCPACRAEPGVLAGCRTYCDEHCKPAHDTYQAERAAVEAIRATGAYTFTAALNDANGQVKLWFRNADGDSRETLVPRSVYETMTRTTTYEEVQG